MKKVLIVSLNFPPSNIASVHRARHIWNEIQLYGWSPSILTVDQKYHKEKPDISLCNFVREGSSINKTKAVPLLFTSWLGLGDLSLRAMPYILHGINRSLVDGKFDVVFMTGWPFYQMLLTPWVHRRFRLPVVLDFQDPWVSAEGATRRLWSKGGIVHRLAVALEPRAVRYASFITGVTDRQNAEMAGRYPWLDASRMAAVPIGGDPKDFVALRSYPPQNPQVQLDHNFINLSYVGAFLPRAVAPVRAVFAALRALRETDPALAGRIRLNFVGTSNQPSGVGRHLVMKHAAAEGVAEHVREHPARVPYIEALSLLANSNALLMIGSDEPHYSASKIYPGLMSGTPYLSIFHSASSAHQILSEAGGGAAHCFANPQELLALVPKLTHSLSRLVSEPASFGKANSASYAPYTAREVAGQFARIFDRVRM